MLADLRAEIQPRSIIDLERIADRDQIERSRDLRHALKVGVLQLGRHSVVHTENRATRPPAEKVDKLDEKRLALLIRQVVSEEIKKGSSPTTQTTDLQQIKDAVAHSVGGLLEQIRDKINAPKQELIETIVDPVKIAELSQQSIGKMLESIETGGIDKNQKIQIINKNVNDLANEL